jgi:hypothetical protein
MFYHLAWWPRYMRTPLLDSADRIRRRLFTMQRSPYHEQENPSDDLPTGEHEENSTSDARRGLGD